MHQSDLTTRDVVADYKKRVTEKYGRLAPLAPILEAPLPYKVVGGATLLAFLYFIFRGKK